MLIAFRVDASTLIGNGHVFRCLTLADKLHILGWEVIFFCQNLEGNLFSMIEGRGYEVYSFPEQARSGSLFQENDLAQCLKIMAALKQPVHTLIVDHYNLDHVWHGSVKKHVKRLMVIDDLADRKLDCDILLDQTFGRFSDDYKKLIPESCLSLIGSSYTLLRDQFLTRRAAAIAKRGMFKKIKRILLTLGGTDPQNHISFILNALSQIELPRDITIDVVLSSNAPHLPAVVEIAGSSELDIHIHTDVTEMAALMTEADIAFGAGGTTSWERCCLALPTLMMKTAENQSMVFSELIKAGAAFGLKENDLLSSSIADCFSVITDSVEKYLAMSMAAATVCDGLGGSRVGEAIGLPENGTSFCPVTDDDCKLLFLWQTIPGIRRFSRNPEPPSWVEHSKWFSELAGNNDRELLIICCNKEKVGFLRLDKTENRSEYEISILVSPEYQGKKIASSALELLSKSRPYFSYVAEVQEQNLSSVRLFTHSGFEKVSANRYLKKQQITEH